MNQRHGEIYVFHFTQYTPNDFPASSGRRGDLFIVYNNSNGNPQLCKWEDNCFWYKSANGEGWRVFLNAEYWFRIPEVKEIFNES